MKTIQEVKKCTGCLELRTFDKFNKNKTSRDGLQHHCRECFRLKHIKDREKINARSSAHRKANPHLNRPRMIARKYGISAEEYDNKKQKQNNKCAICLAEHKEIKGQRLHLDHNHSTGKLRDFLCHGCNTSIGQIKENINTLYKMIDYLKRHQNE